MIITISWLKEHLQTKANEVKIIDQLTNIGLEVENIKENSGELSDFKIAKILKAEKHPNADKLKVCDVSLGDNKIIKVVCKKNLKFTLLSFFKSENNPSKKIENKKINNKYSF